MTIFWEDDGCSIVYCMNRYGPENGQRIWFEWHEIKWNLLLDQAFTFTSGSQTQPDRTAGIALSATGLSAMSARHLRRIGSAFLKTEKYN